MTLYSRNDLMVISMVSTVSFRKNSKMSLQELPCLKTTGKRLDVGVASDKNMK